MRDFCVGERVHFVGIGGVGVNALAKLTLDMGGSVSGSDKKHCNLCDGVARLGGEICDYDNGDRVIGATKVVYSSAISQNHPQLEKARELGISTLERHEYLGLLAKQFDRVVGVGGTHGKTSVTAMICHVLKSVDESFVGLIGGESVKHSNYVNNIKGENGTLVSEACEYRQSLLSLGADVAIVTNAECDHPDCYHSIDDVNKVFKKFLDGAKVNVLPASLLPLVGGEVVKRRNEICIVKLDKTNCRADVYVAVPYDEKKCEVQLFKNDKYVCDFAVADNDDYVVSNALFAIVACECVGVKLQEACNVIGSFEGVKRRFEHVGAIDGARVIFDFAHHPTEIECALKRAKKFGKTLVVFQPHTYTRTKAYFDDFVSVLSNDELIDTLALMPTYGARENAERGYDSQKLHDAIFDKNCKKGVCMLKNAQSTVDFVNNNAKCCDVVVMVGAGDIYGLKDMLRYDML